MHKFILAFLTDLNNKQLILIDRYDSIKLNSVKPFIKYFKMDFRNLLTSFKYFIILNKYKKNTYKILNNMENLGFLYYNNNFYKISFINKLNKSIKLKINKNFLLVNHIYRIKFLINLIKTINILKYKKDVNIKSISKK